MVAGGEDAAAAPVEAEKSAGLPMLSGWRGVVGGGAWQVGGAVVVEEEQAGASEAALNGGLCVFEPILSVLWGAG